MEGAGDDPREQRRLDEHEQRGRDPERDVDAEQHAGPAGRGGRGAGRARARLGLGLRRQLGELVRRRLVAAEPVPEDVVRPALVEEDDRRRRSAPRPSSPRACSAPTTALLDREAVAEVGARDHHARVQAREERRDRQRPSPTAVSDERPAAARPRDEERRDRERGDPERGGQDRREDVLVVAVDGDRRPSRRGSRRRARRPGAESRAAVRRRARSRSPVVRSVRKVAPWKAKSATTASAGEDRVRR